MRKTILIAMAALLVVSFAGAVLAAPVQAPPGPGNGFCPYYGQTYSNLTDDQKTQITAWQNQRLEQEKQMLSRQVEWGWLTQEQADQRIAWMEQQVANGSYGFGMMASGLHGHHGMTGARGSGCW
ncbi:DUF2680 domain-containing protein [Propionispora hippei]|uniref:Zinc resistance-associated protein n=1 Tax=Propionispora hippei DSM 15287 TaxID=1123003 RepID=A0A1M6MB72_9FIRM|nr:DUF2680 domain-containing protein [Propionispora hippei]SHJ80699.1 Protein of unknown function [Propionispora hippei DSM 15287]